MVLHENKDGISIKRKLGDIRYYAKIINNMLSDYQEENDPRHHELELIGKKILDYITTKEFENALIPRVGPIWSYYNDIVQVIKSIRDINQEKFDSEDARTHFLKDVKKQLDDADLEYSWDTLTR